MRLIFYFFVCLFSISQLYAQPVISSQPDSPKKPPNGQNGDSPGDKGGNANPPEDAKSSGNIDVYVKRVPRGNEFLYEFKIIKIDPYTGAPNESTYQFSEDGKEMIVIKAEGVEGANAGDGGDGAKGADGDPGIPATPYSIGTDGEDGKKGGDGGLSTNGGKGGNAGRVKIHLNLEDLSALNLFNEQISKGLLDGVIPGGLGGNFGRHGRGGRGGEGGDGGSEYNGSRTKTVRDQDGNERDETESYTIQGGEDGDPGKDGNTPTDPLSPGEKGKDNTFEIHVTNTDGSVDIFTKGKFQYQVEFVSVTSGEPWKAGKGGNFEPGEKLIIKLIVENVGNMLTPPGQKVILRVDLPSSLNIEGGPNQVLEVALNQSLKPNEKVVIEQPIEVKIKPASGPIIDNQDPTNPFTVAVETFQFRPGSKKFLTSGTYAPAVEIHAVVGSRTLKPGQSTKVRFNIKNISPVDFGSDSETGRILQINIQQMLDPHNSNPNRDLDLGDVKFVGTNGVEIPLSEVFAEKIKDLKAGEQRVVEGKIILASNVKAYQQGNVVFDLYLGNLGNLKLPDLIWKRGFKVQVGRKFELSKDSNNPTKLVVVTNNRTSNSELLFYQNFADKLGIHMADYNLSLYGKIDWKLFNDLQGSIVVFLNNEFDPRSSQSSNNPWPAEFLSIKDTFAQFYNHNQKNNFLFVGPHEWGVEMGKRITPLVNTTQSTNFESPEELLNAMLKESAATGVMGFETSDIVEIKAGVFGESSEDALEQKAREMAENLKKAHPEKRFFVTYEYDPKTKKGFFGIMNKKSLGQLIVYRSFDRSASHFGYFCTDAGLSSDSDLNLEAHYFSLFKMMKVDDVLNFLLTRPDDLFDLNSAFGRGMQGALLSQFASELLYGVESQATDINKLFPSFQRLKSFSSNQNFSEAKKRFMNELFAHLEFMIKPDNSAWANTASFVTSIFIVSTYQDNLKKLLAIVQNAHLAGEEDYIKAKLAELRKIYAASGMDLRTLMLSYINVGGYQAFKSMHDVFPDNPVLPTGEMANTAAANAELDAKAQKLGEDEVALRTGDTGGQLTEEQRKICEENVLPKVK
ncbi:MAG: hypothetical protein QE271_11260 [Bacteriovoracaceae bacterium]|nr:hypothetical protein [Bacteriovoracaceae bacterium]